MGIWKRDPTNSVKLAKVMRKYPCLWNFTSPEYSQKEITEPAWQAVSREMKTSIFNCGKRWTNIRNRYFQKRRKDTRGDLEATYYLAEDLDFLAPLAKISNKNRSVSFKDVKELTGNRIESEEDEESNTELPQKTNESPGENVNVLCETRQNFNRKCVNVNDNGLFIQSIDDKKNCKAPDVDGNRSFLYSLLPYLREMTGKQNRNFRQKVIAVIDEILDDTIIL